MRVLLPLLAALLMLTISVAPGGARPLDDVRAEGILRVAVYEDFAPFSYQENGIAKGIDVTIAKHIARTLGIELNLIFIASGETVDSDLRLNFLRGDLADSPLNDVMMHVPHDKKFESAQEMYFFASPYFEEQLAIAYDKGAMPEPTALGDIAGRAVAVEVDSASDLLLLMADNGVYRKNLYHYRTFAEAMAGFLNKQVSVIAGARSEIEGWLHAAQRPMANVGLVFFPEFNVIHQSWPVGIAVRTDARDLAYEVADILLKLRQDGELESIFARFGVTYRNASGY